MSEIRESWFKTLSLPASGSSSIPILAQAGERPLRVLIRNIGAANIVISLVAQSFVDTVPATETYQIPAGQSDSVVLAPGQRVVAASVGAGGTACIAVSEALPFDLRS